MIDVVSIWNGQDDEESVELEFERGKVFEQVLDVGSCGSKRSDDDSCERTDEDIDAKVVG